jgi:hypothetical protein
MLRVELAKLDILARNAGVARSAFACDAIRAKLFAATSISNNNKDDQLSFLHAAVEELISIHPEAEAIRARLVHRSASLNQPKPEGNIQCQNP